MQSSLSSAPAAWSGTVYTFEPPAYNGSGSGTTLNGQQGWYTPTGYADASVYTYAGTGIPQAPGGGAQFIGLIGPNVEDEHSATFAGSSVWAITFDLFVDGFNGSQTAGSFFLFTGGIGYQLHAFPYVGAAGTWNAKFDVFTNTGAQINGADLGAGFDGLQMDYWYQEQIVFSTASNQILSVSMNDPNNPGAIATYDPAGWYFRGGASGPFSVAGLGVYAIGNLGFDNISLQEQAPEPASWALCLLGAAAIWRLRDGRRKSLPLS